jgi:hypothetical protein
MSADEATLRAALRRAIRQAGDPPYDRAVASEPWRTLAAALDELLDLRGLLIPLVEGEPTFAGEVDGTPYCIYCSGWQSGPGPFPHDADCPWLIARDAVERTVQG